MSLDKLSPPPIKLQASLHETIWGGRNLAAIAGKRLPANALIGESWETEAGNLALNEPYRGKSLGQLVEELGNGLLGSRSLEVFGRRFPLLAKFIDARDKLSVQVHPDDRYAREHEGGKLGKTEAWYILHTEPGAQLVYGLRRSATVSEVRQAIDETRLEQVLHVFEVHPGDVVFVPAGTVHAIGAGVVLYELQEYSDVTYRLYDYGRLQANGKPRELHVEQALDVMRFEPSAQDTVRPVAVPDDGDMVCQRRVLVGCRYFVLEELRMSGQLAATTRPSSCEILSALDGMSEVVTESGETVRLGVGETAVLPASMGAYSLCGTGARILRSYVPEEDDELLALWRAGQPASL
jgi:mannose-6-phosphate isomerase